MSVSWYSPVNVMLLDDHPVVRHGLQLSLERETGIEVVGSFSTTDALLDALATRDAHVLVVDYSLGPQEVDGVSLIRALRFRSPESHVLVVSGHYNPATVSLALRAGARGFVGKTQPLSELAEAIRTVAAGRSYLNPLMAAELDLIAAPKPIAVDAQCERTLSRNEKLSPREREVLRCFLDGMSVTHIAEKFDRSVNTISTQKQAAFRKLGIRTDNELFKIRHEIDGA
jgi:two-component system, NarL family, captular synthesis response regulator RcsB